MPQETDSMRKEKKKFFYTKTPANTRKLSFAKMAESKSSRSESTNEEGDSVTLQWQASRAGLYIYRRELRQKSSHARLFL